MAKTLARTPDARRPAVGEKPARAWASQAAAKARAGALLGQDAIRISNCILLALWANRSHSALIRGHDRVRRLPTLLARVQRILTEVKEIEQEAADSFREGLDGNEHALVRPPFPDLGVVAQEVDALHAPIDHAFAAAKALKRMSAEALSSNPSLTSGASRWRNVRAAAIRFSHGARPDSPTGWAYCSIAVGMESQCESEKQFKEYVAAWRRALARAGVRPGGR